MVYKNLRIEFEKVGALKFISHLDLCRTMREAFNRGKIPVGYSEGFNPHPKMTFALPLSVGCESVCELMDIKVPEDTDPDIVASSLDAVTAPDLRFKRAYFPDSKFNDVAAAKYRVVFSADTNMQMLAQILENPDKITKTSKKGVEKTVDIKPMIYDYEILGDKEIVVTLAASPDNYLNPAALCDMLIKSDPDGDYAVTRLAIIDKNGDNFR